RNLHLSLTHSISITRALVERQFQPPNYKPFNNLSPVVSVQQNFDSLGFPSDYPGHSRTDTYYINRETVLRTHTSAHQAASFSAGEEGFTISADVYRRDAIDRTHYPVFHQMEGARMWSRKDGDVAKMVREDIERLPKHNL
ncbi:phenylalanyl-tRNA synthetase, partial [Tricharina praecox]|uniref:phenylalanyl-tRNA synthetase n=1 Tax=Tricharina praecox TaxID=43433 RepID=UPI002220269D